MAAVQAAAASIKAGMDTVVIAGGAESISTSPRSMKRGHSGTDDMDAVDVAEPPRDARRRPRSTCRSPSVGTPRRRRTSPARRWTPGRSSRTERAVAAIDEGRFEEEIFPLEVHAPRRHDRRSSRSTSTRAATTTMEKLATLKPLHPEIEGFSITAGNASGSTTRAAAMVIADCDYAEAHGLEPLADREVVGVGRRRARATPAWRRRSPSRRRSLGPGSTVNDVDLFEINEAFASMCVATTAILGIPHEITNVTAAAAASATRSRPPAPA